MNKLAVVVACTLLAVSVKSASTQPDPVMPHYVDDGFSYEMGNHTPDFTAVEWFLVPDYDTDTHNAQIRAQSDLKPQDDHDGGLAGDYGEAHGGTWSKLHHQWTWDPAGTEATPAYAYFTGHNLYDGLVDGSVADGAASGDITYYTALRLWDDTTTDPETGPGHNEVDVAAASIWDWTPTDTFPEDWDYHSGTDELVYELYGDEMPFKGQEIHATLKGTTQADVFGTISSVGTLDFEAIGDIKPTEIVMSPDAP